MAVEHVRRFASPVLDERARVTSEARRARARRNGGDGPIVVFGDTVDARFAAHGVDPDAVEWDARRSENGQWVVTAQWAGPDLRRSADWAFSLAGRMVSPLDATAADLLADTPVRPVAVAAVRPPFVPHLVVGGAEDEPDEPAADPPEVAPEVTGGRRGGRRSWIRPTAWTPTSCRNCPSRRLNRRASRCPERGGAGAGSPASGPSGRASRRGTTSCSACAAPRTEPHPALTRSGRAYQACARGLLL